MRKLNSHGSAQAIGIVLAFIITIAVGVMIYYKLNQAVVTAGGGADNIGDIYNSTNATALTIWTLFPIVGIVLIAGVILAVVMGFGRQTS